MVRTLLYIAVLLLIPTVALAQESLTLEGFLSEVRSRNLGLKVESTKTDAAKARAVGFSLPAPAIGLIQMNEDVGKTASGFEVGQAIPFPTKLASDRSARESEAEAQAEMQKAVVREILAKARFVYFAVWAAQARISLLREKKAAIGNHIKLSRAGSRSDSFWSIHILKAESDVDALENEIISAEQALRTRQVEAAVFVDRDPTEFKPDFQEPPLAEVPRKAPDEPPAQLESIRLGLESVKSRELEARASWFPEFNLRYKQMGQTSMFPAYNELMIGVTLPFVYFWEPRAAAASASAQRLQAEYEYSRENRRIQAERASLLIKADSLRKQLETLNTKLLPRAEKRMRMVHNLAPRDLETLQDHRETMEAFPDLKLKALEYREQYEEAVSGLLKYATIEGER